tara:strand:- start:5251 stop:6099 length:849 start_codon:yes stop_codon:yes gene_type:complete
MNNISVILLLFHTRKNLIENLKQYKDFKVLILDQSNDLELRKKIKKFLPKIEFYLSSNVNMGFAKGINFLAKKVKTKYFLCTQPDIKINKKSIRYLLNTFNLKKNCIISVPKIDDFVNFKIKNKQKIYPIKNIIGAIFLTEKKKFLNINMFDENFFFYWEDVDISNRIQKSKYKIYINHNSKAVHTWSSTKFNFRTFYVKETNFKYGELFYQYKNNKLKYIKILRQPFTLFFRSLLYLILLNPKKSLSNLFRIYGIIKFIIINLIIKRYVTNNSKFTQKKDF